MAHLFIIRIKGKSYKATIEDVSRWPAIVDVDGEKFEVEFEETVRKVVSSARVSSASRKTTKSALHMD